LLRYQTILSLNVQAVIGKAKTLTQTSAYIIFSATSFSKIHILAKKNTSPQQLNSIINNLSFQVFVKSFLFFITSI
ncbi:MAG: hypothetical protein RR441_08570, partial [Longicatena sp.]